MYIHLYIYIHIMLAVMKPFFEGHLQNLFPTAGAPRSLARSCCLASSASCGSVEAIARVSRGSHGFHGGFHGGFMEI